MSAPMDAEYVSGDYIGPRQGMGKRPANWSPPVYAASSSAPSTPGVFYYGPNSSLPSTPGSFGGYTRVGAGNWKAAKQRAMNAGEYFRGVHYGKRPSTGPKQPRGAGLAAWQAANPGGTRAALARWHNAQTVGYLVTRPKSRILPIKAGFVPKRAGITIPTTSVNLKLNRRTGKYGRPTLKKGAL